MNNIQIVKQFWDTRPCNIRHSNKKIGTKKYFNEVEFKKYFVEPHIPTFAEFKKWKNKRVLEIGCGIGTDSINFARAGAHLTCVDVSRKSLNLCKKRFKTFNLNATFICCNAEELDTYLVNEKFDLIYSFGVIHHTPNPEKVIECIKKLSRKNTTIKIMLYSFFSYKTFESWVKNGYKFKFNFKKSIQYYAEAQLGCPIAYTYTKKELIHLFKEFKILKIKKDHIFPYIVKHYKAGVYKKRWFFKYIPAFTFNFLERKLGWHWLIELKLKT